MVFPKFIPDMVFNSPVIAKIAVIGLTGSLNQTRDD